MSKARASAELRQGLSKPVRHARPPRKSAAAPAHSARTSTRRKPGSKA
jgi:hypothetical protein